MSNFSGRAIDIGGFQQRNVIGGDRNVGAGPYGQGNLLSNNGNGIVMCQDGNTLNVVTGNLIGTDGAGTGGLGNGKGIWICEGASGNTIGPDNVIARNDGSGILVQHSDSLHNTITQNSIHDNGARGISLWEGGNSELSAPVILGFDLAAGTVSGFTCPNCTVEIFSDSADEGEVYEGQAIADSSGVFAFAKGVPFTGPHLTATATDPDGNTSPFSTPTSGPYSSRTPTVMPSPSPTATPSSTPSPSPTPTPTQTATATSTPEDPATADCTWLDPFDEDSLAGGWSWVREDPSHWSLVQRPGFLRIVSQRSALLGSGNNAPNILLRASPSGDFSLSARVLFRPTESLQAAGVLIYENDDSFVWLSRGYCGANPPACVGDGIYLDMEHEGAHLEHQAGALPAPFREVYLKLVRRAGTYQAYASADGQRWLSMGEEISAEGFDPTHVGLLVTNGNRAATEIPADFDFVCVTETGAPKGEVILIPAGEPDQERLSAGCAEE
jgi:hypothetical protein